MFLFVCFLWIAICIPHANCSEQYYLIRAHQCLTFKYRAAKSLPAYFTLTSSTSSGVAEQVQTSLFLAHSLFTPSSWSHLVIFCTPLKPPIYAFIRNNATNSCSANLMKVHQQQLYQKGQKEAAALAERWRGDEAEMEKKTRDEQGWHRGRKVSRAESVREGRVWWAPNEQIMTGSALEDGVTPPFLSLSLSFSPLLHPPLSPSSPLFSSLSWQFNFPRSPPCSCLLIVSEALSLGPPSTLGLRNRSAWKRRLECQNVIRDSKQPERRRSHTIRLGVRRDAWAQAQHFSKDARMKRPMYENMKHVGGSVFHLLRSWPVKTIDVFCYSCDKPRFRGRCQPCCVLYLCLEYILWMTLSYFNA